MKPFKDPTTSAIAAFLRGIGIEVRRGAIPDPTFLPGILIEAGVLIVDEAKLAHSGDLLHEAGHVAVTEPERRKDLNGNLDEGGGAEMAAIAWSWAALLHLDLDPRVVFHEDGYQGGSEAIISAFSQGRYFGVPLLQLWGMTFEEPRAAAVGVAPYPYMIEWLRE